MSPSLATLLFQALFLVCLSRSFVYTQILVSCNQMMVSHFSRPRWGQARQSEPGRGFWFWCAAIVGIECTLIAITRPMPADDRPVLAKAVTVDRKGKRYKASPSILAWPPPLWYMAENIILTRVGEWGLCRELSHQTLTWSFSESALTTEIPTPCKPPETW